MLFFSSERVWTETTSEQPTGYSGLTSKAVEEGFKVSIASSRKRRLWNRVIQTVMATFSRQSLIKYVEHHRNKHPKPLEKHVRESGKDLTDALSKRIAKLEAQVQ